MPKTRTVTGFLAEKAWNKASIRTHADFTVFSLFGEKSRLQERKRRETATQNQR